MPWGKPLPIEGFLDEYPRDIKVLDTSRNVSLMTKRAALQSYTPFTSQGGRMVGGLGSDRFFDRARDILYGSK